MRIPTYTANFNPSNRAPGASIRARKSFSVAKAELDKAAPVNEFVNQVREVALQRYRVAEELKLDENLLAASDQLRQLEYNMGRDSNIYSVLDGDNPRWNQQVSEIKATLRSNIGTNLNSVMKFESKFNIAEQGARLRLRSKIDTAIAARAALALKQAENAEYQGLGSDISDREVAEKLKRLSVLQRSNYTTTETGIKLTNKGKANQAGHILALGNMVTTEYIQEDAAEGFNRVLDLMEWSRNGAVATEGNNSGMYLLLSQMNETDRTALLNKLYGSAATDFNRFSKAEEAQGKRYDNAKKDLMSTFNVTQETARVNVGEAKAILNELLLPGINGDYLSNRSDTDYISGVEFKLILNDLGTTNRYALNLSENDLITLSTGMDLSFIEPAEPVSRNFSQDRFSDIKYTFDNLDVSGKLTPDKMDELTKDAVYQGKKVFTTEKERRAFIDLYKAPYMAAKINKEATENANQLLANYRMRIKADVEVGGKDQETYAKIAQSHVYSISGELKQFILDENMAGRTVTNDQIKEKFDTLVQQKDDEFKSVVFKDALAVMQGKIDAQNNATLLDDYPDLKTPSYKYPSLSTLQGISNEQRSASLKELINLAEKRLQYVTRAMGENVNRNITNDLEQTLIYLKNQIDIIGIN